MKMKHNKKRNTAFLFEVLIRELTKTMISKEEKKKKIILEMIKRNFKSNTFLAKDLDLYKAIIDTKHATTRLAEKIIYEARIQKSSIDNRKLFAQQTALIDQINKELSPDVFNNFIPNYKDVATIFQIFHPKTKTKKRVIMENYLVKKMISEEEKEKELLKPIDNLTYKMFAKKFNEKYSSKLLDEQKELLRRYIRSFVDNGIDLKVFLNEEIPKLKESIENALTLKEIKSDKTMLENTQRVLQMLNKFHKRPVDNVFIHDILKIQNLVKEIQR
jgi:hypothetical protein